LEAPGLAPLFAVEDQIREGTGVVPLLLATEMTGECPDFSEDVIRIDEARALHLLPAGPPSADYARQLALLDPAAWYRETVNPLRALINRAKRIAQEPDIILIDSRTGISALAAPLLFDIADVAVIAFYPHAQSYRGTRALTRALLGARSMRSTREHPLSPEIRFLVSPVPASAQVRAQYEEKAQQQIREWLSPARNTQGQPGFEALDDIVQVVTYQESVAASGSAMAIEVPQDYEAVAAWIAGILEPKSDVWAEGARAGEQEPSKSEVLGQLRFADEAAERQDRAELLETFLSTAAVERALADEVPLVIGRKGTGKTAIFQRIAVDPEACVITGPAASEGVPNWAPDPDLYLSIGTEIDEQGLDWRQVWPMIIGLAIRRYDPETPPPASGAPSGAVNRDYRKSDLLADLRRMMQTSDASLRAVEWIEQIDRAQSRSRFLLFDALDTGFGNSERDRQRRRESVAGLLTVVSNLEGRLRNLRFKILLREDVWREVGFPNKSHLEARAVRLNWSNQMDYLRIALKQALLSDAFRRLVSARLRRDRFDPVQTPVEYWPEDIVRQAWVILAGDRVSGGNTAYTNNWVWARLADANGDHSPRSLAQLLNAALDRERFYERSNQYPRSVLRPRALVESLDDVSEKALDALRRDEFPELEPLFLDLERIGATPFDADALTVGNDLVQLAREVGLLESASSGRYRVPELFRKALQMGRKGQA
jgi:hypothetical protein